MAFSFCLGITVLFYLTRYMSASITNFNTNLSANDRLFNFDDESTVLEPINGTRDYRLISRKHQFDRPWFDNQDCVRFAACEKLQNNTCFGSKLPYTYTSLALTDSYSQADSQEKLYNYEALRNIPKCWTVIQPFLCAVFAPKCVRVKNRDMVYLPSLEMCRITMEPCRMLYNTTFFPKFLKCNETFFPSKCNNDVREMKFNGMGQCMPPLTPAEPSSGYYKDIEGCGIQCKDPLYTTDEHNSIHLMIFWGVLICALCNVYVIATFSVHEWKKHKYPAKILLYINICFLLNWIGWSMQFLPDQKENIVCRRDGTLRHSEPSAGENLSCLIPFVFIYYFLMAAMVWFALFTYAWYQQTSDRAGNIRDSLDKCSSLFHLIAWPFPLVLTIIAMTLSEVDGNSIVGICLVGYQNATVRVALVLVPAGGLIVISMFFVCRGLLHVNQLKRSVVSSNKALSKLNSIVNSYFIRTAITQFCVGAWIFIHIYEFKSTYAWSESLDEMIRCRIKSAHSESEHRVCQLETRPSVAILQLRICCIFVASISNSSWCWTSYAASSWTEFVKRKFGHVTSDDDNFNGPMQKAMAGAERNRSIAAMSMENTHTDPAGVNFNVSNLNLNEVTGMTSSLLNYMANFLGRRRNATIAMDIDANVAITKQCSILSSFESRKITLPEYFAQVSVECESRSRHINSVDSIVSVRMSEKEVKTKSKRHAATLKNVHRMRKLHKRRKFNRKISISSMENRILAATRKIRYPHKAHRGSTIRGGTKFHQGAHAKFVIENRRAFHHGDTQLDSITNYRQSTDYQMNTTDIPRCGERCRNDSQPLALSTFTGAAMDNRLNLHGIKAGCDIGIQANITSLSQEEDDKKTSTAQQSDIINDISEKALSIDEESVSTTDSDKLRILLLPSK